MATHSSILAWRIPMDKGAWWAIVYGVTKRWTWLNNIWGTQNRGEAWRKFLLASSTSDWVPRLPTILILSFLSLDVLKWESSRRSLSYDYLSGLTLLIWLKRAHSYPNSSFAKRHLWCKGLEQHLKQKH